MDSVVKPNAVWLGRAQFASPALSPNAASSASGIGLTLATGAATCGGRMKATGIVRGRRSFRPNARRSSGGPRTAKSTLRRANDGRPGHRIPAFTDCARRTPGARSLLRIDGVDRGRPATEPGQRTPPCEPGHRVPDTVDLHCVTEPVRFAARLGRQPRGCLPRLIPAAIDHDRWAHWRSPRDMMHHG